MIHTLPSTTPSVTSYTTATRPSTPTTLTFAIPSATSQWPTPATSARRESFTRKPAPGPRAVAATPLQELEPPPDYSSCSTRLDRIAGGIFYLD
jgi:hypothetical protein